MIEKITYIAFDGTEFENDWECEAYERDKQKQGIYTFDYNHCTDAPLFAGHFEDEEIEFNSDMSLDECRCIYVESQESLEFLAEEGIEIDGLNINTLSFFDTNEYCWYGIDELIDAYESTLATLKRMKKNFELICMPYMA